MLLLFNIKGIENNGLKYVIIICEIFILQLSMYIVSIEHVSLSNNARKFVHTCEIKKHHCNLFLSNNKIIIKLLDWMQQSLQ